MKKVTWKDIEKLGWKKNNFDYKKIEKLLFANYSMEEVRMMKDFCQTKIDKLYAKMGKFWKTNNCTIGSDDGLNDVICHVVGLGEKEFNKTMEDPNKLQKRYNQREYEENFMYSFHCLFD